MLNKKTGLAYAAEIFNELDEIAKQFLEEYHPDLMQEINKLREEYETTKSLTMANLSEFVIVDSSIYTPIRVVQACDDRTTVELKCPLIRETIFRGYEGLKKLNLQSLVFIFKERGLIPPRMSFDHIRTCIINNTYYEGDSFKLYRRADNQFYVEFKKENGENIITGYMEGDIPLNKSIPIWL